MVGLQLLNPYVNRGWCVGFISCSKMYAIILLRSILFPHVNGRHNKIPNINSSLQFHSMLSLTRKLDAVCGILSAIVVNHGILKLILKDDKLF